MRLRFLTQTLVVEVRTTMMVDLVLNFIAVQAVFFLSLIHWD